MSNALLYALRDPVPDAIRSVLGSYDPFLQNLLYYRGIEDADAAHRFLNPSYDEHLHDPFLMKDMERAVERVLRAIREKEHVVIFSDYDCDGVPGGTILHDFFTSIRYPHFSNYIPHRHEEGFGLNLDAIEQFGCENAKVIITVDCGSGDVEPIKRANELGIDVIVTDHHEVIRRPDAYAILNPKQSGDEYPFKGLCGSGVAWKLASALAARGRSEGVFELPAGAEKWWLDMAGLGTLADMVPLLDENRVLASYGLRVLRKSRRLGLQYLCRKMKTNQLHLTEDDVGFMIVPRLNAASRMGIPMDAFRLLTASEDTEAERQAEHLDKINDERKGHVAAMVKEIKRRLEQVEPREVIVMGNPDWRPGLVGLAANSLMEEYRRPVFLWGREGGTKIKGSCRSDGSVSLTELMTEAKEAFIEYGGHKLSGGFSVIEEAVHSLEAQLLEAYGRLRTSVTHADAMPIDADLSIEDVSWATYRSIEQLAPFGMHNPKPLFRLQSVTLQSVSAFGAQKNHLRLGFRNRTGKEISAIGFFMSADRFGCALEPGTSVTLIANMEKSMFRNFPELRLRIVDVLPV